MLNRESDKDVSFFLFSFLRYSLVFFTVILVSTIAILYWTRNPVASQRYRLRVCMNDMLTRRKDVFDGRFIKKRYCFIIENEIVFGSYYDRM